MAIHLNGDNALMTPIEPPQAVIFDWDNTLIDSWQVIHESFNRAMQEHNFPLITLEEAKAIIHKSLRDTFPTMFGDKWQDVRDSYYKHHGELHIEQLRILEGAQETLELLLRHNIPAAVVSNKTGHILRKELEHLGWGKYFDKVIGSTDLENDKPAPDPVHHVLEGHSIKDMKSVWFVGDSIVDMQCAKNTGCTAVLFGDGAAAANIADLGIEFIHTKDHNELRKILSPSGSKASAS
jgi:phosphoglycolate phosphatase